MQSRIAALFATKLYQGETCRVMSRYVLCRSETDNSVYSVIIKVVNIVKYILFQVFLMVTLTAKLTNISRIMEMSGSVQNVENL